jgi:hypothetical protein
LASSDKTNESAGASKVSDNHCVEKDEKSCEMSQIESTPYLSGGFMVKFALKYVK